MPIGFVKTRRNWRKKLLKSQLNCESNEEEYKNGVHNNNDMRKGEPIFLKRSSTWAGIGQGWVPLSLGY